MAALPQQALSFNDVFDDENGPSEPQTVHHIRANSSIMQLKKILGMFVP
jgi:pyruvate carboxylase